MTVASPLTKGIKARVMGSLKMDAKQVTVARHHARRRDFGQQARGTKLAGMRRLILAYLFGLDCGSATVPTVIVAEGSIVDGITIIVSHEWL